MREAQGATYCASCFAQKLGKRYVDFDAFYDGPVIDPANGIKQPIDDLIICEECIEEAAGILGLVRDDELKQENRELGEAAERHREEIVALHELVSDLERSLEKFTSEKILRPDRKPRIVEKVELG